MTVSSWGGLILAEDGEGVQHLIGVAGSGETYSMARDDVDSTEFTGRVCSHDRRVLFADVQAPGTMLAITCPWRNQR